jgi:hypothetical protein
VSAGSDRSFSRLGQRTPIDSMTHRPHPEEAPQVGHARLRMTCALLQDQVLLMRPLFFRGGRILCAAKTPPKS